MHIRVIVVEVMQNDTLKETKKLTSSANHNSIVVPEVGKFHLALVVGPFYFEWCPFSLIIPRRIPAGLIPMLSSVQLIEAPIKHWDLAIDKLCHLIVEWNISRTYSNVQNKSDEGNAQVFIDAVLNTLNIGKDGLDPFLQLVKPNANSTTARFVPTPEMQKKYQLNNQEYVFHSHAQLDVFAARMIEQFPAIEKEPQWKLLKAFDR